MLKRILTQHLSVAQQALAQNALLVQSSSRAFAKGSKLAKFDYLDPLVIEGEFTEEEKMVRDSARAYSQERLMTRVRKAYNDESFDREIMREMGAQGFLGCTIGEYNLPGVSSVAYGLINREVERVDSGYRSALSV